MERSRRYDPRAETTVDEVMDAGLYQRIGRRNIDRFLSDLARPHVVDDVSEAGYQMMADDAEREAEAVEWSEGLIGDAFRA